MKRTNISQKYKSTIAFLFQQLPMFQRIGNVAMKKDLGNIRLLCEELENPHLKFRSIHIAGTNGKGSSAHLMSAMLQANGYKVGLYTSPHYKDFRERIKINGKLISKRKVVSFVERNKNMFEDIRPSFFEWSVALAFETFAKEKVDIAVIETGLGGRLDSTNILVPEICLITNISFDHQQFLGDTLPEIAEEKAGIIKLGIPVVIGELQEEVMPVFRQKAKAMKAQLSIANEQVLLEPDTKHKNTYRVYINNRPFGRTFTFPLKGSFQLNNLKSALLTLKIISDKGKIELDPVHQMDGIERIYDLTAFIGRWQILGNKPMIIGDSGHNEAGLSQILEELHRLDYAKLHFVLGMVKDKALNDFLRRLPKKARYYFCKAAIPRGLEAKLLKEKAAQFNLQGRSYVSVKNAFQAAKRKATKDDLIFVGGSIFVLAEVL